jgi:preprotein translocase subunit SecG
MIFGLLAFLFLIVCLVLIFLVLVQDDKGGGISGAIGGGISSSANSVLGSQNAENILTRGTRIFAALFFVLAIVITLYVAKGGNQAKSSVSEMKEFTAGVSEVAAPAAQGGNLMPFTPSAEPATAEQPSVSEAQTNETTTEQ